MHRPGTIERAYELARSGDYGSVNDIRAQLKREFHESVDSHLGSPTLGRQLRLLCAQSCAELQPSNV